MCRFLKVRRTCFYGLLTGGVDRESYRKISKNIVFVCFPWFLFGFSWFCYRFSVDFCKGRIPPDTLQIPLEAPKILPLSIFSVLTPENTGLSWFSRPLIAPSLRKHIFLIVFRGSGKLRGCLGQVTSELFGKIWKTRKTKCFLRFGALRDLESQGNRVFFGLGR